MTVQIILLFEIIYLSWPAYEHVYKLSFRYHKILQYYI